MKQDSFASRLARALKMRDMSAAELSRSTKIPEGTISCYKKGLYEAKQDKLLLIAKALRVNPTWLMGYDVPMEREPARPSTVPPGFEPLPKMKKVPLIGDIACGEPITAEQNIVDYVDVPDDIRCNFALRCHGDSMIEAGIQDNDVVYIRTQPEVEDGEIAAVRIGGEATLKRVYYDGESLTLMPCNSRYRPKTYSGQDLEDIRIEGKAIGFFHWF